MMRAVEAHSWPHRSPPDRSGVPPFGSFHALAVHDGRRRTGLLADHLTGLFVESMVQTPQRAVALPAPEVVMPGAARGQVLGQGAPLAARAQDVEHGVEHLAHINPALPPRPALRDVYEGAGQVPFGVGHVTRITQALAVVGTAGLGFSPPRGSLTTTPTPGTQPTPPPQPFFRPALKGGLDCPPSPCPCPL